MMCNGFIIEGAIYSENETENDMEFSGEKFQILDDGGGDKPANGIVAVIHSPEYKMWFQFDLGNTKALIETLQDIVKRYEE